jgi:hypothetical protein
MEGFMWDVKRRLHIAETGSGFRLLASPHPTGSVTAGFRGRDR